jgi:hypothetical protein
VIVQIGATYNDLGATIEGPTADLNLGITTYLNGTLTQPLTVDTTQPATDTIDYVATDQNGLAVTTTRTVIIEAAATASRPTRKKHKSEYTSRDLETPLRKWLDGQGKDGKFRFIFFADNNAA